MQVRKEIYLSPKSLILHLSHGNFIFSYRMPTVSQKQNYKNRFMLPHRLPMLASDTLSKGGVTVFGDIIRYRQKPLRAFNLIRPGGGAAPKSFWLFLNILLQIKKNVMCTLTGVLRGVSNRPVKKYYAYFEHINIFSEYYSLLSC